MHTHQLQIVDADEDTVTFSFSQDDKQIEVVSFCNELAMSIVTYIGHKEAKALLSFLENFNEHMYHLETSGEDC